jgi:hypothetical protein
MTKYGAFVTTSSDSTKGWIPLNIEHSMLVKPPKVECNNFFEYMDPDKPRHRDILEDVVDQNQARKPSRGFAKYINRTVNPERPD